MTGADLMRCEDCLGAFVSKSSAAMLAALPADEAPPSESPEVLDPLPWQRFIMALKKILGLA